MTQAGFRYLTELVSGIAKGIVRELRKATKTGTETIATRSPELGAKVAMYSDSVGGAVSKGRKAATGFREEATKAIDVAVKSAAGQSFAGTAAKIADSTADTGRDAWQEVRKVYYQSGNCAQWTSEGLAFAGLTTSSRLFPKSILIELFESELLNG